jgi:hypothetical protein
VLEKVHHDALRYNGYISRDEEVDTRAAEELELSDMKGSGKD